MPYNVDIPRQQLPYKSKTKKWRKQHLDWADDKSLFNFSPVRKSVQRKKINYDLVNGVLYMEDLEYMLNPDRIRSEYIPEKIQHYPIINASLNVLRGEELARVFDYQVVVTNPDAVSDIELSKRDAVLAALQTNLQQNAQDENAYNARMEELGDYFQFTWKDMRELRANRLLTHYWREQNFPQIFNDGFMDALTVGEEIYQCTIEGGEPVLKRLNPMKVRVFMAGNSRRIEDADIVVIEDYISPGKIVDIYGEQLTPKQVLHLEELPRSVGKGAVNSMDQIDERHAFLPNFMITDQSDVGGMFYSDLFGGLDGYDRLLPYDLAGNIRVIQMYWKSRRRIKKVKSYNEEGKEEFHFYTEQYVIDEAAGETEETFWINQAWEGVKIGDDIYVNMGPCPVQYNSLSNPSRCHFGIIGSVYNFNDSHPYSMVDMMKPFSYLYDAVHDRLNKLIARNWGKIIPLDLAKVPHGWEIDKWIYYARANNLAVYNSMQEGPNGLMVGAMNNNYSAVIDAETGDIIQQHMNILEYIKQEIGDVTGITKQRIGQISSRETVGGVERSTLQSTHITEWLFSMHDDLKKRVLTAFLETAKIAVRGRKLKFRFLLDDGSYELVEIDGDQFCENDYGLVVDNSTGTQKLSQNLEGLAQAGLQNQLLTFSSMMKLYGSASLSQKQRMIENAERRQQQQAQQQQQQAMQQQQQALEMQMQQHEEELALKDKMNQRDNDSRVLASRLEAEGYIQAAAVKLQADHLDDGIEAPQTEDQRLKLQESIRQFDRRLALDERKQREQERSNRRNEELQKQSINAHKNSSS